MGCRTRDPQGSIHSEDTVLVQLDLEDDELGYYAVAASAPWMGSPKSAPVRSVDPLPDTDDTGVLSLRTDGERIAVVVEYDDRCYTLSRSQARNLARKLTEATDE